MDVELTEDNWVLTIPIAPNYTAGEGALVINATVTWVRVCEALQGPASTDGRPIDHDALVQYILARDQKRKRLKARKRLWQALKQHLGG